MLKKGLSLLLPMTIICCSIISLQCDNGNGPDNPAGPLELVSPKGGESYQVGQTVEVKWKINDATKISSVGIKLSLDNGKSFLGNDLETSSIFPPTTTFSWTITDEHVSSQCLLEVYDYIDNSINDKSGTFSVSN